MLQVMNDDNNIPLEVLAVVDDDTSKHNETIVNKRFHGIAWEIQIRKDALGTSLALLVSI